MIKLIAFFKRTPGMPVETFQTHWRTAHAELVAKQTGLRRYVQNHTLPSGYRDRNREPDYDGVAEAWFDSVDAMRALADSPSYAAVRADEANFIDAGSMRVLLTDEVVIIDGATTDAQAKLIGFLPKREDLEPKVFRSHWREQHASLATRIPGQRRYVQCHARPGVYASGRKPVFDGIAMSWFESSEALRAAANTVAYAETRADEVNFLAPGRLAFVIAREVEIEL